MSTCIWPIHVRKSHGKKQDWKSARRWDGFHRQPGGTPFLQGSLQTAEPGTSTREPLHNHFEGDAMVQLKAEKFAEEPFAYCMLYLES